MAGALILVLLAGGIYIYTTRPAEAPAVPADPAAPSAPATEGPQNGQEEQGPLVRISSVEIPVELALTPEEQEQGLSGRPGLDADKGMLFIFPEPGTYSFWMPDMNFPIDIIWINDSKVVDISADVPNDFDPADPVFYRPAVPAQYVLEVNAGFAKRMGIDIGDDVIFANILE